MAARKHRTTSEVEVSEDRGPDVRSGEHPGGADQTGEHPGEEQQAGGGTISGAPDAPSQWGYFGAGLLVVLGLSTVVWFLTENVPLWTEGTSLERLGDAIEFPIYAIAIGLLGNYLLSAAGVREHLSPAFRTEFFIKVGLVLLGLSVNLSVIATAAAPAIAQSLFLVVGVFLFTWWLGGKLGLTEQLRALLSSALSICGVSAAIAAAGAVRATKEQLAYVATLVIVFALPSIFLMPWLAGVLGLNQAQTGAWIGGNIDTTAAVTAAGTIAGEDALAIAAIVKSTQNVLIGVVALALTAYFALKVERRTDYQRPGPIDFWNRFPKFVLGFLIASIIGTIYLNAVGVDAGKPVIDTANDLRTWFFTLAFVSIGLEFSARNLRSAGAKPVLLFGAGTLFNLALGLVLATVLFAHVST